MEGLNYSHFINVSREIFIFNITFKLFQTSFSQHSSAVLFPHCFRMLERLVERLLSGLCQKQQAQARVEQLQQQTADLPRQFPWPGLGDRRLAVEHVRSLLNRTKALPPALSDLQAQGVELFHLTQDPNWIDSSWGALEKHLPPLLKDLTVSMLTQLTLCTSFWCTALERHA